MPRSRPTIGSKPLKIGADLAERAIETACSALHHQLVDLETALSGGLTRRDRSGLLNRAPSAHASGEDHVAAISAHLRRALEFVQTRTWSTVGSVSAELDRYKKKVETALKATQALEGLNGTTARVPRQRAGRTHESSMRAREVLSANAAKALDAARNAIPAGPGGIEEKMREIQAIDVALLTLEISDKVQNLATRALAREAAQCISRIDLDGWRVIVAIFLKELGLKCPDPKVNRQRFDELLGEVWVANNIPQLPPSWRAGRKAVESQESAP